MKIIYSGTVLAITLGLTGCVSSSKVQEMIDTSNQDSRNRTDAHEASIDVLKQSAMAGLEKSKANAITLDQLQKELDTATTQLKIIQGYAEASKVLSAANTVKVADLEVLMTENQDRVDATTERLEEIDKLYEEILVGHYQAIVDSATAAIESLKEEGWSANTNAPVNLAEPIEIVAPNTAPATTNKQAVDTAVQ